VGCGPAGFETAAAAEARPESGASKVRWCVTTGQNVIMTGWWSRWWVWGSALAAVGAAAWFGFWSAGTRWAGAGVALAAVVAVVAPLTPAVWQAHVRRREAAKALPGLSAPTSFAGLLRADRQVVPFVGRRRELADLLAWCHDPNSSPMRLVVGPGGVGKTRLAGELMARLGESGWWCKQVGIGLEAGAVDTARQSTRHSVLLVVDYAETRSGLPDLLRAIADVRGRSAVRVLLLARGVGEWWDRLAAEEPALRSLVDAAGPVTVGAELAERLTNSQVIDEAVPAFADWLAVAMPRAVAVDAPSGDVPVLVLHAASLVVVLSERDRARGGQVPAGRLAVDSGVLGQLLGHEERLWQHSRKAHSLAGLSAASGREAVALACLLTPADLAEAAVLLRRIPELADSSEAVRRDAARWLRQLYPPQSPGTWWGSLAPDLVAEHLVSLVLEESPDLAEAYLAGLGQGSAIGALTVLARASQNHPAAAKALDRALRADLDNLGVAAVEVALQTVGVVPEVLAGVVQDISVPISILTRIERAIPYPTVVLAAADLALTRRIVAELPVSADRNERAAWLNTLSLGWTQVGHAAEALPPAEEAVALYRRLAQADERNTASLAGALSTLGEARAALDRPADALVATEEAVALYRWLAQAEDRYVSDLASALSDLGVRLSTLGHSADALAATEEAVATYRQLAQADERYAGDLARTLSNLGARLFELGRLTEALAATEQAVLVRRRLAEENPDRYLGAVSNSLSNLGLMLSGLGREHEALAAAHEAVEIRRRLAKNNPDRYLDDLAAALNNLGQIRGDFHHPDESILAHREALGIYRRLADRAPGLHLHGLAVSLANFGESLADTGHLDEAVDHARQAVTIYRQLVQSNPDAYLGELAMPLHNLGEWLLGQERAAEALSPAEESEQIRRVLAGTNPDRYLADLGGSLQTLSAIFLELGHPEKALAARNEAQAIQDRLNER
jgi:tetratricopeptide (TPR) repeat protein